jgi:hypothetical protein
VSAKLVVAVLLVVGPWGPVASAADPAAVEAGLTRWIGTAKDGWTPVAFAALRAGMLPAEVGQHFPGAEKTRAQISQVRVTGLPHLSVVAFTFMQTRPDGQKGLSFAIVTFERGFFDDKPRYEAMVRVLEAKYGPMRQGPSKQTKGFWQLRARGDERFAQFIDWGRGQDVQLSFDFPADAAPAPEAPAPVPPATSDAQSSAWTCRAVDVAAGNPLAETSGANMSGCTAAVREKLQQARCTGSDASVTYRLQHWIGGRWTRGVQMSLRCR